MQNLILSTCTGLFVGLSAGCLVATAMIRNSSKKWQKIVDRYERLLEDVDIGFRETPVFAPAVMDGVRSVRMAFAEMEQVDA